MKNYLYSSLINIERDSLGNISLIKTDVVKINEIISQITDNIENALEAKRERYIKIKIGSITGIKIISGFGPDIILKIASVGNVSSTLESEFKSTGINQTLHRVYLDISCNISILTPFETINEKVDNRILLAESIIVGRVPEGYYNTNNEVKEEIFKKKDI